jgi:hypothetical protein
MGVGVSVRMFAKSPAGITYINEAGFQVHNDRSHSQPVVQECHPNREPKVAVSGEAVRLVAL